MLVQMYASDTLWICFFDSASDIQDILWLAPCVYILTSVFRCSCLEIATRCTSDSRLSQSDVDMQVSAFFATNPFMPVCMQLDECSSVAIFVSCLQAGMYLQSSLARRGSQEAQLRSDANKLEVTIVKCHEDFSHSVVKCDRNDGSEATEKQISRPILRPG